MNARQREFVSKYLSDVSKGLLLAVAVGAATGRLRLAYTVLYLLLAGYAFAAAYLLEGHRHAAD